MEDLTGTQLGPYKLIERIGRGGMSAVYRATRLPDEPPVAVKVMDTNPDTLDIFVKRFEQEVKIVATMQHPNILPLLDYGHQGNYPYMVMKLVSGGTLADILRQNRLPPPETGGWLYQIALALDHAHQRGVVHRDLKPTNILLDDKGQAYLTDFGIAKLLNIVGSLTVTGNVVGTPTYMAPEQWRGEDASPLTDIYGLGVLVYLMLAGKPPFHADTPHSLMYMHLNETPPPLRTYVPDISEAIDQVVLKALAKDPKQRYPTAAEFSHDFQRALRGLETLAQRFPPYKRSHQSSPVPQHHAAFAPPSYQQPTISGSSAPPQLAPRPVSRYPYPYQSGDSIPYQPVKEKRPKGNRRLRLTSCLLMASIAALMSGFGYIVSLDPDRWLPAESPLFLESPPPTITPNPNIEKPTVVIEFPENGTAFNVNQGVVISIRASDRRGITKIEVRRFGYIVQTLENPDNSPEFQDTIIYQPHQSGRHVIEIVPYSGTVRGDSAILEIIVLN